MSVWQSIILGLVEGVTEFLPISSTGHLILVSEFLRIDQVNFTKSFEIIIQLGAILSVLVLYWPAFLNLDNLKKLLIAFIPTGIIGFLFYKLLKTYLLGNYHIVLWSLFIGGLVLILFERWHRDKGGQSEISQITYRQSFLIGLCQSLAIIPGVSRSAATIVGGLSLGLNRQTIVEFSFLLAVPTMLVASLWDLLNNWRTFSADQTTVLTLGFLTSFVTAILGIKFFLHFLKKHDFTSFGIYRVLIAICLWFIID